MPTSPTTTARQQQQHNPFENLPTEDMIPVALTWLVHESETAGNSEFAGSVEHEGVQFFNPTTITRALNHLMRRVGSDKEYKRPTVAMALKHLRDMPEDRRPIHWLWQAKTGFAGGGGFSYTLSRSYDTTAAKQALGSLLSKNSAQAVLLADALRGTQLPRTASNTRSRGRTLETDTDKDVPVYIPRGIWRKVGDAIIAEGSGETKRRFLEQALENELRRRQERNDQVSRHRRQSSPLDLQRSLAERLSAGAL